MNSLKANTRNTKSKGDVRSLRLNGNVPAIIYGGSEQNKKVSVSKKILKSLLDKGYIVSSIDNYDSGSESNHVEGCTYYKGDIVTWIESNMEDFEICFHLAGLSRIQPSFSNPDSKKVIMLSSNSVNRLPTST